MADTVFVTGGARGIGRAVVLECLGLGYDVAFSYLSEKSEADSLLAEAKEKFPDRRTKGYALDVRKSADVDTVAEQAIEDFGSVYGVVCNAGVNVDRLVSQVDDDEWDDIIRTNLSGAFYTCRAFLDHMMMNKRGRIVMLSSLNREGAGGAAAYSASKAGMVGLARSIAKEYGARGITCNLVAPGFVESGMTSGKMTKSMEEFWLGYCPLGRLGQTHEVAYAVGFFLSERASLINGVTLPATGGLDWRP